MQLLYLRRRKWNFNFFNLTQAASIFTAYLTMKDRRKMSCAWVAWVIIILNHLRSWFSKRFSFIISMKSFRYGIVWSFSWWIIHRMALYLKCNFSFHVRFRVEIWVHPCTCRCLSLFLKVILLSFRHAEVIHFELLLLLNVIHSSSSFSSYCSSFLKSLLIEGRYINVMFRVDLFRKY